MQTTLNAAWVQQMLLPRSTTAHKGNFGTLTILAGSAHYPGAAMLAAAGALRAGAGIVRLAATAQVCAVAAAQLPACTYQPLAQNAEGGIASAALPEALAPPATALLAGCGLGNTAETGLLVAALLDTCPCPFVLDADALNVLAGHLPAGQDETVRRAMLHALATARQPVIVTPHIGEMSRLCGIPPAEAQQDMAGVALQFASRHNCVVVLKSHVTVVATPSGELYVNNTAGNAGLAKGGSGDVLAGIIAALLAQGHAPHIAAAAGVWLHAAAADAAVEITGETGLSPADLPTYLCTVWRQLGR
ncbi:NAD(P)H-hydrate dehydratase [Ruminococcaceae bacterium OttesenSCG-928-A16]|nr:NAD(P)H-hydrate dehydratase [Ruminococcaceae bacterium OttesenSCG-928-A16]